MNENEFKDRDTSGESADEQRQNPYAAYINKNDCTSENKVKNDNPYSKNPYKKAESDTDEETHYTINVHRPERERTDESGENPYSRFISEDDTADEPCKNDNPYSKYYKDNIASADRKEQTSSSSYNDFAASFKVNETGEHAFDECSAHAPLIDENRVKGNFRRIGFAFLLFSLISTAVVYIIMFAVIEIDASIIDNIIFRNLITPVAMYLFALPVLLSMLSPCEAKAPEKKRLGVGKFLLFLIVAFGFMYIGGEIGNYVMQYLGGIFSYDYSNGLESIIDYDNIWITAFFTVIVAPIGEEFVFRKLLIDRTQKHGAFISIGLSGLMFGLMHGNFYQFFYAFALGLLLGYIYYHTGKLYLTVVIHAIVNFVGSVLVTFLLPVAEKMDTVDLNDPAAFTEFLTENMLGIILLLLFVAFRFASMVCAVVMPIVFRKKLSLPQGEAVIPKKRVLRVVILNAGIISMLAVYILEFASNIFLPLLS